MLCVFILHSHASEEKEKNDQQIVIPAVQQLNRSNALTTQKLSFKRHFFNVTHINHSDVYCIPKDEKFKNLKGYKGIICSEKYIFVNNDSGFILGPKLPMYSLRDLNIKTSNEQPYEGKKALAFYAKSLKNCNKQLFFALVTPYYTNKKDLYFIFPTFFGANNTNETDEYFFDQKNITLVYQKLPYLSGMNEDEDLYKTNLYVPTIKSTDFCCIYAFLHCSNKAVYSRQLYDPHKLFITHWKNQQSFSNILTFDHTIVENELKKFCLKSNNSLDEKNYSLKILFYWLYMHKVRSQKQEGVPLGENTIQKSKVELTIAITDTQCFEHDNSITANILVKIFLTAKIQPDLEETIPIYAIFSTDLPLSYTNKSCENWHAQFFQYITQDDTYIRKNFYFQPDPKAMPSNDVRSIKEQDEKIDIKAEDTYTPFFIERITKDGITYADKLSLPSIEHHSQNLIEYHDTSNNFDQIPVNDRQIVVSSIPQSMQFHTTDFLYQILENMKQSTFPSESKKQKNHPDTSGSGEQLFLFAQSLIYEIEKLESHVTQLQKEIFDLSKQHNGLFELQYVLDQQEKNIKPLIDQMNKLKTEIDTAQKDFVKSVIDNLKEDYKTKGEALDKIKADLLKLAQEAGNDLTAERKKMQEQNTLLLNQLKTHLENTNKTNVETQFTLYINQIEKKQQDVEKMIQNVKTLLFDNTAPLQNADSLLKNTEQIITQQVEAKIDDLSKKVETTMISQRNNIEHEIKNKNITEFNKINNKLNETTNEFNDKIFYLTTGLGITSIGFIGLSLFIWWYIQHTNAQLRFLLQHTTV